MTNTIKMQRINTVIILHNLPQNIGEWASHQAALLNKRYATLDNSMSQIMTDHQIIQDIMRICTHDIVLEVGYEFVREDMRSIFTKSIWQRAEAGNKSSIDTMACFCEKVPTLSIEGFFEFTAALKKDYPHIVDKINLQYRKKTGRNLPTCNENANNITPATIPAAVSQPSLVSPTMGSLSQPLNSTSFHPNEVSTVGAPISSNFSTLPIENRESSAASAIFNCVSVPAVPCPSEQISKPQLLENSTQLPCERINNDQISRGNSTLENISLSENSQELPASYEPSGVDQRLYDKPDRLKEYEKMRKEKPDNVYAMETLPRGRCLMINNEKFEHLNRRKGSREDSFNLSEMFKFLGFEVVVHENKTASVMTDILKEFAKSLGLDQLSALAVVILSHGEKNDCIFGSDGDVKEPDIPIAGTFITKFDLQQIFCGRNCPSMIGKPKLFILQACRGKEEDMRETGPNPDVPAEEVQQRGSQNDNEILHRDNADVTVADSPGLPKPETVADTADMYFLHSSSLGYKAYRSTTSGSPFVKLLTEKVIENAHNMSFDRIVTDVRKVFKTKCIGITRMTMPECSTTLTEEWYLNPPDL